jgi:hypothetical protein
MHVHAQAIGIDKSASQIAKATSRHQQQQQLNLSFHQIEAWDLNSVLKLTAAAGLRFSVVFIDVSGSRRVGDVDNLVMKYEQVRKDVLLLLLMVVVVVVEELQVLLVQVAHRPQLLWQCFF